MSDARSTASGTSAASGKRKLTIPAYYAVKVGRTPGIYYSWSDAQKQTQGVSAVYRKFSSLTEAEQFMKSSSTPTARPGKIKYYAVAVGHVPGIYQDWPTVQAQIKDCKGAKQKAFSSYEEAKRWLDEQGKNGSRPISLRGDLSETSSLVGKSSKVGESATKKQKKNDGGAVPMTTIGDSHYDPGLGPLPLDAEDGFDRTIKYNPQTGTIEHKTQAELNAVKRHPTGDFSGPIEIYTDGSSLRNGKVDARAGVGVYFGPNDGRNVSEPLQGAKQTNQRAELTAIQRALDNAPINRDVQIYTDSYYSINCCTVWFQKWENSGWKTTAGKPVDNRDLVEPIIARIRDRETCRAKTNFTWVKGHSTNQGNIMADQLAVSGARGERLEAGTAAETETVDIKSELPRATDEDGVPPEFKLDGFDKLIAGK